MVIKITIRIYHIAVNPGLNMVDLISPGQEEGQIQPA